MGKSSKKKKPAAPQLQPPQPPSLGFVTPSPAIEPKTPAAVPIGPTKQLSSHPFEILLRGARESGLKEGLAAGEREKGELLRRVIELEESLKGLRAQFGIAQERGAAIIAKSFNDGVAVEKQRSISQLEEERAYQLILEEQLATEENRRVAEVAAAKKTGQSEGYDRARDEDRVRLEQQPAPPIHSSPKPAHTLPTAHTSPTPESPSIRYHQNNSIRARANPWSSIARRHNRHTRTRTRWYRTEFISKIPTINSSQYIIPPRRTLAAPKISTHPIQISNSFSDTISRTLSAPSTLLRGLRFFMGDEGVASFEEGTCGSGLWP